MSTIPALIEGEQKTLEREIETHKAKSEELRRKGFSEAEISSILPDNQVELGIHNSAIVTLKKEQENIQAFLNGSPVYNTDLLDMSKLAPFMQRHKTAE
jgi:hypothetical protein